MIPRGPLLLYAMQHLHNVIGVITTVCTLSDYMYILCAVQLHMHEVFHYAQQSGCLWYVVPHFAALAVSGMAIVIVTSFVIVLCVIMKRRQASKRNKLIVNSKKRNVHTDSPERKQHGWHKPIDQLWPSDWLALLHLSFIMTRKLLFKLHEWTVEMYGDALKEFLAFPRALYSSQRLAYLGSCCKQHF